MHFNKNESIFIENKKGLIFYESQEGQKMNKFIVVLAFLALFAANNVRAEGYMVPEASQQPKNVTYMYSHSQTITIDGRHYTRTASHAANGKDYVQ